MGAQENMIEDLNNNNTEIKMMDVDIDIVEKPSKREVTHQILILFGGLFCCYGSFRAILSVLSSINIQGAVGQYYL